MQKSTYSKRHLQSHKNNLTDISNITRNPLKNKSLVLEKMEKISELKLRLSRFPFTEIEQNSKIEKQNEIIRIPKRDRVQPRKLQDENVIKPRFRAQNMKRKSEEAFRFTTSPIEASLEAMEIANSNKKSLKRLKNDEFGSLKLSSCAKKRLFDRFKVTKHSSPPTKYIPICDINDKTDDLYLTEYIYVIMDHLNTLQEKHSPSPNYIEQVQTDITPRMRTILIDWLIEVQQKFALRLQTLYLSVNYIDRFLSLQNVNRNRLQLVGCTAMMIATKMEEIHPPSVKDFAYICSGACTVSEIKRMEHCIAAALDWNFTIATPLQFCERFLRVSNYGPIYERGLMNRTRNKRSNKNVSFYAQFFLELSIVDYKMIGYKPSQLAAASVYLALKAAEIEFDWTEMMEYHTSYSEFGLMECVRDIKRMVSNPDPKAKSARKKYLKEQFGCVASVQF